MTSTVHLKVQNICQGVDLKCLFPLWSFPLMELHYNPSLHSETTQQCIFAMISNGGLPFLKNIFHQYYLPIKCFCDIKTSLPIETKSKFPLLKRK